MFLFYFNKTEKVYFFLRNKKIRNRLQRVLQQGNYPRKASPFPRLDMHSYCNDKREHTAKDISQSAVLHTTHHWRDEDI